MGGRTVYFGKTVALRYPETADFSDDICQILPFRTGTKVHRLTPLSLLQF